MRPLSCSFHRFFGSFATVEHMAWDEAEQPAASRQALFEKRGVSFDALGYPDALARVQSQDGVHSHQCSPQGLVPVSPRFGDDRQNHSFKRGVLCDAVRECVRALPHSPLSKAFYLVVPAVSPELLLPISSACVFRRQVVGFPPTALGWEDVTRIRTLKSGSTGAIWLSVSGVAVSSLGPRNPTVQFASQSLDKFPDPPAARWPNRRRSD